MVNLFLTVIYKRDPSSGEIQSAPGSEYYDDNVPYDGVYLHYTKKIVEVSMYLHCYCLVGNMFSNLLPY